MHSLRLRRESRPFCVGYATKEEQHRLPRSQLYRSLALRGFSPRIHIVQEIRRDVFTAHRQGHGRAYLLQGFVVQEEIHAAATGEFCHAQQPLLRPIIVRESLLQNP